MDLSRWRSHYDYDDDDTDDDTDNDTGDDTEDDICTSVTGTSI